MLQVLCKWKMLLILLLRGPLNWMVQMNSQFSADIFEGWMLTSNGTGEGWGTARRDDRWRGSCHTSGGARVRSLSAGTGKVCGRPTSTESGGKYSKPDIPREQGATIHSVHSRFQAFSCRTSRHQHGNCIIPCCHRRRRHRPSSCRRPCHVRSCWGIWWDSGLVLETTLAFPGMPRCRSQVQHRGARPQTALSTFKRENAYRQALPLWQMPFWKS